MNQLILIIVAVVVGLVVAGLVLGRKTREQVAGICLAVFGQTARKNVNKEKITAFLREKGEASNEEIRKYLGVSRRSVVRYLDELEREGKAEQVGKTGYTVIYRLK